MFTRTCVATGVIYPNEWRPRGKVANVAIRRGELWPLARLLGNGNLRSFWQTGGIPEERSEKFAVRLRGELEVCLFYIKWREGERVTLPH